MAQGTWTTLNNLAPDYNGGVMLLLTDGTVITKTYYGGVGATPGTMWDKLTPDSTGSYINGTWSQIAPMNTDRLYFSSWVLNDGRVYIGGAEYGDGTKAEIYDPRTNTWSTLGAPGDNFYDGNSENLPDGKLLLGVNTGTTLTNYIFDPGASTFTPAGSCIASHDETAWLKLPDSSILQIDIYSTNSERYIPATDTWIADGTVPDQLYDAYGFEAGAAFMLPDGRGFFIGSTSHTAYYTPSGNSSPGTWAAGPDLPSGLGAPDAPAAMMVNGKILLTLSPTPSSGSHFPTPTYFYEFDYTTDSFTLIGVPGGGTSIGIPTYISNMLQLPDGNVLYSFQGTQQYYAYTPGSGPLSAGKPTADSVIRVNCDTFKVTGKLFTGISEGASYGDDWMMSTNYPMVKITSGTNVYYARTYNWNRPGTVMTGTLPDTVSFVTPAGLGSGSYALQVVVNGNASNTVSFSTSLGIKNTPSVVCQGSSVTLTDTSSIGLWTTSNTAVAAIGSVTGIVQGIAGGPVVITYSIGACYSVRNFTVNALPSAISGTVALCLGNSATLSSSTPSGTWSTSSSAIATVGTSSGFVNSVAAGNATISYTLATGCYVTAVETVNALPSSITGTLSVCAGSSTTLTDAGGGVWTSGTAAVATVGSLSGLVNGITAGTAQITYTIATGCHNTVTVTVNPLPAVISGTGTVCPGSTTTLTDAGGGTWSSGATATASIGSASGIVSGIAAGTAPVTYTLPVTGCIASTTITVNPLPAAISGTTNVCQGATTTLSDGGGGTWSSSAAGTASVGSSSGIVSGVAAGTASISYTTSLGCSTSVNVTVNALPAAITGTTAVCIGSTTALTGGGGGIWSSGTPAVGTVGSASGIVSGISAGSTNIIYTLSTGCSTSATVTVNPLPAAISGTTAVCAGSSTSLTDAGGGVWSSASAGTAIVGSASGIVTGVAAGTAPITYTSTAGCNASTIVTVNSLPATISGSLSICTGSASTLTDAGGGTWVSGSTGVSTIGSSSGLIAGISNGTSNITYTLPTGCSTVSIATVNVAPAAITGTTSLLFTTTTALSDTSTGGVWSSGNTSVATINSTSGLVTGIIGGTAPISYSVAGCNAVTSVTVSTAAVITGLTSVCSGSTVLLSIPLFGGGWSSSNTSIATVGSGSGVVTGVSSGTDTISYSVMGFNFIFPMTVYPLPATIVGYSAMCQGGASTFRDASSGGTWSSSNSSVATVNPTTGIVAGVSPGSVTISYTTACSTPATYRTTINALPAPGAAGTISGPAVICIGATGAYSETVPGGTWSVSAVLGTIGSASGVVSGLSRGAGQVTYTVANSSGCKCSTTMNVAAVGVSNNVYTIAGLTTRGVTGDGGPSYLSRADAPRCVATDNSGNIYYCETSFCKVRQISPSGIITNVAGTGTCSTSGDGGQATAACVNVPNGLVVDASGNLLISCNFSNTIRKVNVATGIITTVVGNGTGSFSGDGGPASAAVLNGPQGICKDTAGNIYISDDINLRVRKINYLTGIISTIIGTGVEGYSGDGGPGTAAHIGYCRDVQIDNSGNLYIADADFNVIRKYVIATGIISTFAGNGSASSSGDGGPATAAAINVPVRVAFDHGNNLYISEQYGNKIRVVNMSTGIISTAVGNGTEAFAGDGGAAVVAELDQPSGIACDKSGNLYIGDYGNHRIRMAASIGSVAITLSGSTSVPTGTPITFTAFASFVNGTTIQWQKNGSNVGSGGVTYTNSAPVNGDVYRCILTISSGCGASILDTSNSITISVYAPPPADPAEVLAQNMPGSFALFPNPVDQAFTVKATEIENGETVIKVYDQLGKLLLSRSVIARNGEMEEKMSLSGLPSAVYVVAITDAAGNIMRRKIVKN